MRQTPAERRSEGDWQRWVCRQVEAVGGEWQHETDSRKSPEGWPDLVIALAGGRTLYRELKFGSQGLTPRQQERLRHLRALGHDAGVWRFPRDAREVLQELGVAEAVREADAPPAAEPVPDPAVGERRELMDRALQLGALREQIDHFELEQLRSLVRGLEQHRR